MEYHSPVLLHESIDALNIQPKGTYMDATFGGGGHSSLIMKFLGLEGKLLGFDQDEDALKNLIEDERFVFVHHNFRYLKRFLKLHGVKQLDGIFADLGVSSHQLDKAERGFSFRFEAQLDMRMNQKEGRTAGDIINAYSAVQLQELFSNYGEIRNARTLAQAIVTKRKQSPVQTIGNLLATIKPLVRGIENKYYAKVFQALRIEINDEMGALKQLLEDSLEVLKPGGRLVIITYHSIEDRVVKNFFKFGNTDGVPVKDFYGNIERPLKPLVKKPICPSPNEIRENPRARSAKLRIAERI